MREGQTPPATLEGWYVLHQLFRLSWPEVKALPPGAREELGKEFGELFAAWGDGGGDGGNDGWSGVYRLVGGMADFMAVHFRTAVEELSRAERGIQLSGLADHLRLIRDYLSVVELGLYSLTAEVAERSEREGREAEGPEWEARLAEALEEQRGLSYVQRRLHPVQPEHMPYVCFYPMNKRRDPGRNWYTLPLRRRSDLMAEHGSVGRRYADRISQVISGSIGLDDWEWAVTLFARDPLDFKAVVTDMRFDRASAEYAEFGDFYVGKRMDPVEWEAFERW